MEDGFLADCMILYIKRELALIIDVDSIVDELFVSNLIEHKFSENLLY